MKTYAFVFARGGSKGVPGKNIRELAGKPLLLYSIELAKKIDIVDKIFVSTEDKTIANIARENGATVIERPVELSYDDTPEWFAWQHAVEWLEERNDNFNIFLSLPTTSPLRNSHDIQRVLKSLDENTDAILTITKSSRSPWFNMVRKNDKGNIEILNENQEFHRRQDTPNIFDLTTVAYATRPEYINSAQRIFQGRVKGVEIPVERAIDIDSELDFQIAEFLMMRKIK